MVDELAGILRTRGYVTNPRAFGSVVLALLVVVGLAAFLASSSVVCAAAFSLCAVLALGGFARTAKERREAAFREEIPDVIRSLIVCFGAGMTLHQAAEHVASEFEGPTKAMFEELARTLEMGVRPERLCFTSRKGRCLMSWPSLRLRLTCSIKAAEGWFPFSNQQKKLRKRRWI